MDYKDDVEYALRYQFKQSVDDEVIQNPLISFDKFETPEAAEEYAEHLIAEWHDLEWVQVIGIPRPAPIFVVKNVLQAS